MKMKNLRFYWHSNCECAICQDRGEIGEGLETVTTTVGEVCKECSENFDECQLCEDVQPKEKLDIDNICDDCRTVAVQCKDCDGWIDKNAVDTYTIEVDGKTEYLCESCYEEVYTTCEDCGKVVYRDEVTEVHGHYGADYVCDKCLEESDDIRECECCELYYRESEGVTDNENTFYCEDCYNRYYYTCSQCGNFVHHEDVYFQNDDSDYPLCESCYDEIDTSDEIEEYGYAPIRYDFHTQYETLSEYDKSEISKNLFLGVELEVASKRERIKGVASEVKERLPFIYCKSDSSITEDGYCSGFEIVTHPCTLNFLMDNRYEIENTFNYLRGEKFVSHDAETCGLHVHVNRSYLGNNETEQDLVIAKIMLIMDTIWEHGLVDFTRRGEYNLRRWARRCKFDDRQADEETLVEESKSFKGKDRYFALNLRNEETIEFRLFRGTLKANTYFATLQFVHNVVEYAKDTSLRDIQQNVSMEDIVNYYNFKELNRYVEERNILG